MSNVDYLLDGVVTTIVSVTNVDVMGSSKMVITHAGGTDVIRFTNIIKIY